MVGWYRRPVPLLQRRYVVREERLDRDPSVCVAMVDVATDVAAGRLLAEFSRDRRRFQALGGGQSDFFGGGGSGDYNHGGSGPRAASDDADVPGHRLFRLLRDLDPDHANPFSLS